MPTKASALENVGRTFLPFFDLCLSVCKFMAQNGRQGNQVHVGSTIEVNLA